MRTFKKKNLKTSRRNTDFFYFLSLTFGMEGKDFKKLYSTTGIGMGKEGGLTV